MHQGLVIWIAADLKVIYLVARSVFKLLVGLVFGEIASLIYRLSKLVQSAQFCELGVFILTR